MNLLIKTNLLALLLALFTMMARKAARNPQPGSGVDMVALPRTENVMKLADATENKNPQAAANPTISLTPLPRQGQTGSPDPLPVRTLPVPSPFLPATPAVAAGSSSIAIPSSPYPVADVPMVLPGYGDQSPAFLVNQPDSRANGSLAGVSPDFRTPDAQAAQPTSTDVSPSSQSTTADAGADPDKQPSDPGDTAWRLLAQLALHNSNAAVSLLDQASQGQIPAEGWIGIAFTLVGESYQDGVLVPATEQTLARWSEAEKNARLDLIEALLAVNPNAPARHALQTAASVWLQEISRKQS